MPHMYVEPDLFVEHNDVQVFHIYKSDEIGQGARNYWYSTEIDGSDMDGHGENGTFDVRMLDTYKNDDSIDAIKAAIVAAIDDETLPL